ncbi:V-set and transmembrane domain-containing protein 2-like protein [Fukomys damarensis]|uniref:V-set and transmembrane domain-containing protein 2-like protein n=1 Tax=Fukomys damarensis TaxID=885580 RepID=UPI001455960F|nr:V-set and transmembrane domain-containing protein 2-like protein [Fukomys damarensis]
MPVVWRPFFGWEMGKPEDLSTVLIHGTKESAEVPSVMLKRRASGYLALFLQLGGATRPAGHAPWDNHVSGHALFTETPHDMTARTGEDVEMACSFRGSGSPSYSLEIQWWYVRSHRDWADKQAWAANQLKASPQEDPGKDATKISVVKVVGSNISHKLRLSRVKPTDEGTYECRVIDFSDGKARHHKVKAYLRVQPGENSVLHLTGPPVSPPPMPGLWTPLGSSQLKVPSAKVLLRLCWSQLVPPPCTCRSQQHHCSGAGTKRSDGSHGHDPSTGQHPSSPKVGVAPSVFR